MEAMSVDEFLNFVVGNLPNEVLEKVIQHLGREQLEALATARPGLERVVCGVYQISTKKFAAAVIEMLPDHKQFLVTDYLESILSETTIARFAEKQIRNQKLLEAALFFLSDEQLGELEQRFPGRSFNKLDRDKYLDQLIDRNRIEEAMRIITRLENGNQKDKALLTVVAKELDNDRYPEAIRARSQIIDPTTKWQADIQIIRFFYEKDEIVLIRKFAETLTDRVQKADVEFTLLGYDVYKGNWEKVITALELGATLTLLDVDMLPEEMRVFKQLPTWWRRGANISVRILEDRRPDIFVRVGNLNAFPVMLEEIKKAICISIEQRNIPLVAKLLLLVTNADERDNLVSEFVSSAMSLDEFAEFSSYYERPI